MTRDLVDQMGDRGRLPRDIDSDSNAVESVKLTDLELMLRYDTGKAVLVSDTGEEAKAVWLPLSMIEIERRAKHAKGVNKAGQHVSCSVVQITVPTWLAKEKGLI